MNKYVKNGITVIIICVVGFFAIKGFKGYLQDREKQLARQKERENPTTFLNADGQYKENFFGDHYTIEGKLTNNAFFTTYKDVIIEVTYYSKTKSVIGTERFTLYEFVEPLSTIPFELSVKTKSNAATIGWDAVSATVSGQF